MPRRGGTTAEEMETWLMAPTDEALRLQRPLPDGALKIVARGDRRGDPPEAVVVKESGLGA